MENLLRFVFCFSVFFPHTSQSFARTLSQGYPPGLAPSGQSRRAESWSSLSLHALDTAALPTLPSRCAAASSFWTVTLFSTSVPTLNGAKVKQVGSDDGGLC